MAASVLCAHLRASVKRAKVADNVDAPLRRTLTRHMSCPSLPLRFSKVAIASVLLVSVLHQIFFSATRAQSRSQSRNFGLVIAAILPSPWLASVVALPVPLCDTHTDKPVNHPYPALPSTLFCRSVQSA
jgi:hypothetical protein